MPFLMIIILIMITGTMVFMSILYNDKKVLRISGLVFLFLSIWLLIGLIHHKKVYESNTYPIITYNDMQYVIIDKELVNVPEAVGMIAKDNQALQVSEPKNCWDCGIYWHKLVILRKYKLVDKTVVKSR